MHVCIRLCCKQTAEESEEEDFSPSRSRELQFALSSIQVSPTDSVGETPPHFSNPPNITPLNFCRRNIRRFPANYHLPSDPRKVSPSNMKAKFDEQRFSPSYLKANALESGITYANGQPHVSLVLNNIKTMTMGRDWPLHTEAAFPFHNRRPL